MEIDRIEQAIKKEVQSSLGKYFSYAWRDKIGELLQEETKYARLSDWFNNEIEKSKSIIGVFSPADKNECYSNSFFNTYLEEIKKLGVLIHLREILLDSRTTLKMRENIEYATQKLFGVHYSEELKEYV